MKRVLNLFLVLLALISADILYAAPLKVAVSEFKVTGAANRDELKGTLQALLSSRLGSDAIQIVEAGESPDMTVTGSYIAFGKVFSLDARVISAGKTVAKGFEQGESADDIIPAVTRLGQKLGAEIARVQGVASSPSVVLPAPALVSHDVVPPTVTTLKKNDGDIIKPEVSTTKALESGMIGQRLEGVIISVAEGKRTPAGERELIAATASELRLYLQGTDLKLQTTLKDFAPNDKIIAVDTADLDKDGVVEVYLTMLRGDELASRVYLLEKGTFRRIAVELPYFFRGVALKGIVKKIYAQQMGRNEDYFGGMYEIVKNGDKFTVQNQLNLPRFANLFNTNQITDRDGKSLFTVINPDNYILVYDDKGDLLWKSSDKFGGSDIYFSRDDSQNQRTTGSKFRRSFLEQRTVVTKTGVVIVPKNEGLFITGDSRTFNKNSVYAFRWNGAALDELWHTKSSQNYLSDYLYDEEQKVLLTVEVVKKEGVADKGASAISVKKVE